MKCVGVACIAGYWLACAGSIGVQYAFGLTYVFLMETFPGASLAEAAMVGSLCSGLMEGLGVVSGLVIQRWGARVACVGGALLSTVGLLTSSLVSEAWWVLLLSYSVCVGFGHSLCLCSAVATTNRLFDTALASVHGLARTGASMTPLLFGAVGQTAFDALGWRSSLLVLAAADATVLLMASALLAPPCAPARAVAAARATTATRAAAGAAATDDAPPPASDGDVVLECGADAADPGSRPPDPGGKPSRASASAADAPRASLRELVGSARFRGLGLGAGLYGLGAWTPCVHLVRMALDGGVAQRDASQLLLFLSLGTLIMRVPVGVVADYAGRRRTVATLSAVYALVVAACALEPLATSTVYMRCFGFGVGGLTGGCLSTFPTLPAELLPPRLRPLAANALFTPLGVGFVVGPVVAGAMVSASGSYVGAKLLSAACLAAASAVLGWLPLVDDVNVVMI